MKKRILSALPAAAFMVAFPALADDHGTNDQGANRPAQTPMSAHDLITMPRLGSPIITQDGRFAVYRVTETDGETYERSLTYFLKDLTDPAAQSVALDLGGSAYSLSFGADNFLYFLSDRDPGAEGSSDEPKPNATRLWRAALEANGNVTGPMLVGEWADASPAGFTLSPDASKVAVWAAIARDCPKFGCEHDGAQHTPGPGTGRLYDGKDGFFRHWDQWTSPGTVNRVFVFDIANGQVIGDGTPVDVDRSRHLLVGSQRGRAHGFDGG